MVSIIRRLTIIIFYLLTVVYFIASFKKKSCWNTVKIFAIHKCIQSFQSIVYRTLLLLCNTIIKFPVSLCKPDLKNKKQKHLTNRHQGE